MGGELSALTRTATSAVEAQPVSEGDYEVEVAPAGKSVDMAYFIKSGSGLHEAEQWLLNLAKRSYSYRSLTDSDLFSEKPPKLTDAKSHRSFVNLFLDKAEKFMALASQGGEIRLGSLHRLQEMRALYHDYLSGTIDSKDADNKISMIDFSPRIDLHFLGSQSELYDADRYLLRIAKKYEKDLILDDNDFLIGMKNEFEGFMQAANTYLKARSLNPSEDQAESAQKAFFAALAAMKLPPDFWVVSPDAESARNTDLLGVKLLFGGGVGNVEIEGQGNLIAIPYYGFALETRGVIAGLENFLGAVEVSFLFPNWKKGPQGGVYRDGERVALVKSSFEITLIGKLQFEIPLDPDFRLFAGAGFGVNGGRYSIQLTPAGKKYYRDPCETRKIQFGEVLEKPSDTFDEAKESAACSLEKSLSAFFQPVEIVEFGMRTKHNMELALQFRYADTSDGGGNPMPEMLQVFLTGQFAW